MQADNLKNLTDSIANLVKELKEAPARLQNDNDEGVETIRALRQKVADMSARVKSASNGIGRSSDLKNAMAAHGFEMILICEENFDAASVDGYDNYNIIHRQIVPGDIWVYQLFLRTNDAPPKAIYVNSNAVQFAKEFARLV